MNKSLLDLPLEVLLIIFSYLNNIELMKLRLCCMTVRRYAETLLRIRSKSLIVTNCQSKDFQKRSIQGLDILEKYRVSNNWLTGRYRPGFAIITKRKCMPWLQVTDDSIWVSSNKQLLRHHVKDIRRIISKYTPLGNVEINTFISLDKLILTGDCDGHISICDFDSGFIKVSRKLVHDSPVIALSSLENVVFYGTSRADYGYYKYSDYNLVKLYSGAVDDRVKCLQAVGDKLAIGTTGNIDARSLLIHDIESQTIIHKLGSIKNAGIFDLKWENDNELFTCGHKAAILRWDMREPRAPVQSWHDPFLEAVYCIDTDNLYTFVTGAQYYGRLVLWDVRKPKFQQMYYLKDVRNKERQTTRSPIYKLYFEQSTLMAVTDQKLHSLDFSARKNCIVEDFKMFSGA